MLSVRWATRIAALETRMRELLTSYRSLRSELDMSDAGEAQDSLLSNPMARDVHQAVNATISQLISLLERHDAIDLETLKPDLVRIFADLPSDLEPLTDLGRLADILREMMEIVGVVLDERRYHVSATSVERASRLNSGVFLKTPTHTTAATPEPVISWAPSTTGYSLIAPVAQKDDERRFIKALAALPDDRFERVIRHARRERMKQTG